LQTELVEQARRAVAEGRADSVSAYVAAAIEEKRTREDLAALLEEMLAETGGPLTPESSLGNGRCASSPPTRETCASWIPGSIW